MIGVLKLSLSEAFELTLGQLNTMYLGHLEDEWTRTSSLMALIANCNRGPETQPFSPDSFNPFRKSPSRNAGGEPLTEETLLAVRDSIADRDK